MATAPPWSYSSLTAYETCPKRYYLTRVAKLVKEPPTEATTWGNTVHKALELRLKEKTPLPAGMEQYEKYCARIEASPGTKFTETRFAITERLTPAKWFGDDCWARCIIDAGVIHKDKAVLFDWKTGKIKQDSAQMLMSAGLVFHSLPKVNRISTMFIWLKEDKTTSKTYERDQVHEVWQEFVPRVMRLNNAYEKDKWEAKPSGLCRNWCPVGKQLCEHCGK